MLINQNYIMTLEFRSMTKLSFTFIIMIFIGCTKKQEAVYPISVENYFENVDLIIEAKNLSQAEIEIMLKSNIKENESNGQQHLILKIRPKRELLNKIKKEDSKNLVFEESIKNTLTFGLQKNIKLLNEVDSEIYSPVLYFLENSSYVDASYLIFLRFDVQEASNNKNWFIEIEPSLINESTIKFPIQLTNS